MSSLKFLPVAIVAIFAGFLFNSPASADDEIDSLDNTAWEAELSLIPADFFFPGSLPIATDRGDYDSLEYFVRFDPDDPGDADLDGLEDIETEIVSLELTGSSSLVGPVTIRLRDPANHPGQKSLGTLEEQQNNVPGKLEVCPALPSINPPANESTSLFIEVEGDGLPLHNHTAIQLEASRCRRPQSVDSGAMVNGPIGLYDDDEDLVSSLESLSWVGTASVGGIVDLPTSDGSAQAGSENNGYNLGSLAALAGVFGAIIIAGGWYARRRWLR